MTQKKVITKNRITSKISFRLTQNFSCIRSKCAADISKVSNLYYKISLFHWRSKMCFKWAPRSCRRIWIWRSKFSITLPHSSIGIAHIAVVIAAFRSGIVWGLLPYTLSLRHPTDKNLGGSSPVNAATTAGHTCGWSVGQGNAAVALPMIRFRSGGWHHPAGTTGGPWRPISVDQVLSRTCQAPGNIARCWLSQTARCRPRTRMVQWCHVWRWQPRQCTSQSVMAFCRQCSGGVLPQKMLVLEFTWPDNRKCASSENQTLSRKSGTASILSQNH